MTNSAKYRQTDSDHMKRALDYRFAEQSKAGRADWTEWFDYIRTHLKGAGK